MSTSPAATAMAAKIAHAARHPRASRRTPLKKSALPMLTEATSAQLPW
jgi:hypothetical protein